MVVQRRRAWFEVWGEEQAQNGTLKLVASLQCLALAAACAAIVVLVFRGPVVVALEADESSLVSGEVAQSQIQAEADRVVRSFIRDHYNWDAKSVEASFARAASYVASGFQKDFLAENTQQVKLAREKNLTQKFFVVDASFDGATRKVRVLGERIIVVDGLRAASPLELEVGFEYGPRTEANPEGVYITSEARVEGGRQ